MGAVYTRLPLLERRKIETWLHAKVLVREMARVLKHRNFAISRMV